MESKQVITAIESVAGFDKLSELDRLVITDNALALANEEYRRLLKEAIEFVVGDTVLEIAWLTVSADVPYRLIGLRDLSSQDASTPARTYLSAWRGTKMVGLASSIASTFEGLMEKLEYKMIRAADKSTEIAFPSYVFSNAFPDSEHVTLHRVLMPEVDLETFSNAEQAREAVYLAVNNQLVGLELDSELLAKANTACDNVIGRLGRTIGSKVAESSMFASQAIAVAKEAAAKECQRMQAMNGKMSDLWATW